MSWSSRIVDASIVTIAACALAVTGLAARNSGLLGAGAQSAPAGEARREDAVASIQREANWLGPRDAPIVITEFADFECPVCQQLKPVVDSIRNSAPQQIAVAFVHFPLSRIHPHAYRAALIAECAAEQGNFEHAYNALFNAGANLGAVSTQEWAKASAVKDTAAFGTCVDEERGRARVERHFAHASSLRLRGTPTFAVNETLFETRNPVAVTACLASGGVVVNHPRFV
ncbi:MAG: DsbA family protein [Gemmatimonas sp.]|jgi:protein-disulfide isomerase|uniref:DsbA family protein n=1 Tax=Gemmatimonas sp. TaxID=1962908 RepID=UPI00391EED5B